MKRTFSDYSSASTLRLTSLQPEYTSNSESNTPVVRKLSDFFRPPVPEIPFNLKRVRDTSCTSSTSGNPSMALRRQIPSSGSHLSSGAGPSSIPNQPSESTKLLLSNILNPTPSTANMEDLRSQILTAQSKLRGKTKQIVRITNHKPTISSEQKPEKCDELILKICRIGVDSNKTCAEKELETNDLRKELQSLTRKNGYNNPETYEQRLAEAREGKSAIEKKVEELKIELEKLQKD
jgi:hypothetical protein